LDSFGRVCPIVFSNGSRGGGSFMNSIDAVGCLRSLRAHVALDGVSWVQSGSVEIAVGQPDRMLQNRRRHRLPPVGVAPLGSSVRSPLRLSLLGYAGLNSVPCRSMACMIMARRRASAIRALRIVDRLAIANAQSLSFSGPL
jgi:hypothetical protein